MLEYYETQDASLKTPKKDNEDNTVLSATDNGFLTKTDDFSVDNSQKTEFDVNEEYFSHKQGSVISDIPNWITKEDENIEYNDSFPDYNTILSNSTRAEEVNKNKPWRKVIRRRIANG